MTRGRPPQKALDDALPIAKNRGRLMQFADGPPPFVYDFLFMGDERICCAWVKRSRHIRGTPGEMEAQFSEAVATCRQVPAPADLTREIWFWSPYGTFRFFRIEEAGLIEIDRNGRERPGRPVKKQTAQRKPVRREKRPAKAKEKEPDGTGDAAGKIAAAGQDAGAEGRANLPVAGDAPAGGEVPAPVAGAADAAPEPPPAPPSETPPDPLPGTSPGA